MTTSYTFINPVAARLFAEWWHREWISQVSITISTVTLRTVNHTKIEAFKHTAQAFNAAAQKAREIGEGDDEHATRTC